MLSTPALPHGLGAIAPGHILLILAALGSVYLLLGAVRRLFFSPLRHIPGPRMTKLTGLDLAIQAVKGARVYKLEQLHARYGPVVQVGPNEVSVGSWRHLRAIYTNNRTVVKEKAFYEGASFVGKHNIFQMLNPTEHAARRKLSSPPYSLQSVSRLDGLIREKAEALARRLVMKASTSDTGTVNAYELCGLYSFEVVCKAGFAKEFQDASVDDDDDAARLLKAMDGSALTLIYDNALPLLTSTGLGLKLPGFVGTCYRQREYWREKSREMVDHFLKNAKADEKYLLSPLANGVDGFLGRKLSHEELVEEAMGYMFAGSGTTSSTLTYLLYAISRPQTMHIQARLRDEIASLPVVDGVSDVSAVRQNAYVNAVIREVMRLYPTIVSTLPRVLLEPMQIDKYTLPAGTVVGMQNWIHHRDPAVFPEPDKFIPERWLRSNDAMDASLTPFSIGRRNCIGQNLAWQELYWAVLSIMRARLETKVSAEMQDWEMEMEDRFNIAPRGRRLMLEVTRLAPTAV